MTVVTAVKWWCGDSSDSSESCDSGDSSDSCDSGDKWWQQWQLWQCDSGDSCDSSDSDDSSDYFDKRNYVYICCCTPHYYVFYELFNTRHKILEHVGVKEKILPDVLTKFISSQLQVCSLLTYVTTQHRFNVATLKVALSPGPTQKTGKGAWSHLQTFPCIC